MPKGSGRSSDPNAEAPAALRPVLRAIDRLSRVDGWLGGLCLVALTCLIIAEVALRTLSNFTAAVPGHIPVAWEYSSYLMAASFTFGAAMTLRAGGHIRVSLLLGRLGAGQRRLLETLTAAIGTVMTSYLAYAMTAFTWGAYVRGQTAISSDTPLWIPQMAVTLGVTLLALQFLARTIQAALGLPLEDHSLKAASPVE